MKFIKANVIIAGVAMITLCTLMLPRHSASAAATRKSVSESIITVSSESETEPAMIPVSSTLEINSDSIYWNKLGELGVVWSDYDTPLFYITPSCIGKGGSSVYHLTCWTEDYGSTLTDENGEIWNIDDAPEMNDDAVVYVTFDSKGTPELTDDVVLNIAPVEEVN